jgi:putative alpha-1,2-mannosidase
MLKSLFATPRLVPQVSFSVAFIGRIELLRFSTLSGETLSIIAKNQTAENVYVQSVTWNGVPIDDSVSSVKHSDLMQGGTLMFTMGPTPYAGTNRKGSDSNKGKNLRAKI